MTYTSRTPNVSFVVLSPSPIAVGTYTGSATGFTLSTGQYYYNTQGGVADSITITKLNSSYVSGNYRVTIDTSKTFPPNPADTFVVRGTFTAGF